MWTRWDDKQERRVFYVQTWSLAVKIRRIPLIGQSLYALIQKVCRHEPSLTEWGYGTGNDYGDVWCRWCNKMGQIPKSSLSRFANARSTIWSATGCDINYPEIPVSLDHTEDNLEMVVKESFTAADGSKPTGGGE